MSEDASQSSKRVLDPLERSSEVLFGLIMVLTFTSTLSAAQAGRTEVRTMIIGALGCNLAWGIIDGVMYLMAALSEKGHNLATYRAVVSAPTKEAAYTVIRDGLPNVIAKSMHTEQLEAIRQQLLALKHLPRSPRLRRKDWRGAWGVFWLVFLSTFPVVAPFFLTSNVLRALRISNGIAVVMLALTGYWYGHYSGSNKWGWMLSAILLGGGMVALTVKLGG